MKLLAGLVTDVNDIDAPEGSWKYGRNGMYVQQGAVSNELGFFSPINPPEGKMLIGNIPLPDDRFILFYVNAEPVPFSEFHQGSSIYILSANNVLTLLAENGNLNFRPQHPINGKFKFNNSKELIIVFTDFFNPPRLVNLKTANSVVNISSDKSYNLFHNLRPAQIPSIEVLNGGSLQTGTYQFAIRYKYLDNSETGVFFISNTIPVYKSNSRLYNKVEGSQGGQTTSKSIKLNLEDLDTSFKYFVLFAIKTIDQITTAEFVGEYEIQEESSTVIYSSNTNIDVALSEILTSFSTYRKIKTFEVHQDWLFGGNIEVDEPDANYQLLANNIVVKWNAEEAVSVNQVSGSYKDPSVVYIKRGFMPNEVYAFYIRFILRNGKRTQAYHIPGRTALAGEKNEVTEQNLIDIDGSAKNFHLKCTAQQDVGLAKGLMGYWENENETYPSSSSLWGSNASQPVRHHRFPDVRFLSDIGPLIDIPSNEDVVANGTFDSFESGLNAERIWFVASYNSLTYSFLGADLNYESITNTYPNVGFTAPTTNQFNFSVDLQGTFSINQPGAPRDLIVKAEFFLYKGTQVNPQQTLLGSRVRNRIVENGDATFNEALTINGVDVTQGAFITVFVVISTEYENNFTYTHNITSNLTVSATTAGSESARSLKILGAEFSNIQIPVELKSQIEGYEIVYAQKGLQNSQIVGYGYMANQQWYEPTAANYEKTARFYSFDMLNQKPAIGLSHIKVDFTYGLTGNSDLLGIESEHDPIAISNEDLFSVEDLEYVPNDNTAVSPTNKHREEYIKLQFFKDLPTTYAQRNFIVEAHAFKKNVYLSFNNQILVSTGKIFYRDANEFYSTGRLFGGDTFASPYGIGLHYEDTTPTPTTFKYKTVNVWTYSISNIGLRYSEQAWDKKYYPQRDVHRNLWNLIADELIPAETSLTDTSAVRREKELLVMKSTDLYLYNLDYSRLNSQSQSTIFLDEILSEKYPFRVIRGLPSIRESNNETWRNFPAFDYYEMPKEKGEVWNLASLGSVLLIHQEYMLYRTRGNGVLRMQSNDEIQLGDGDVFEFRPEEVIPVGLSYAGTKSMYACLVCKLGYVFIDQSQGRVFIYSSELNEVSNKYMLNFFNENFKRDTIDNPYLGRGFSIGYDNRYNRLLFSFSGENESLVISYSNYIDAWAFYHSYKSGVLFNSPNKLMSIEHFDYSANRGIYQHNDPSKRGIYYDQVNPEPFVIDIPMPLDYRASKKTISVSWIADRLKDNSLVRDRTFDRIFLHNSFQATGYYTLSHYDYTSGNLRNIKNSWNFDLIRNIGRGNEPIINGEINLANINNTKPWYEREEFEDKYIVVRLVFNNNIEEGIQDIMFLYDVSANNIVKTR